MIHPIGNKNHAYGEQTQSRWNGIVGKLELYARPATNIESVRIFPELKNKGQATCEVQISGLASGLKVRGSIIDPENGAVFGVSKLVSAGDIVNLGIACKEQVVFWSEFTPKTYIAKVELLRDGKVYDTR